MTLYGGNFGVPGQNPDPSYAGTWESTQGQNPAILGGISEADWTGRISSWPGNVSWSLQSQASSPNIGERAAIPSLSVGMDDGSTTADQFFKNITSGQYDASYTGILQSVKDAGYSEAYLRPGWEFNGNWMNWSVGTNYTDFISAFQHLYTLWHNWAAANGMTVVVDWNPAQGGAQNVQQMYPGDAYVDNITFDSYGVAQGGTPDSQATDMNSLSIQWMAEFAAQHGKPFGLDEVGAGSTDTNYPGLVAQAITNAANAYPGQLTVDHVIAWDRPDGFATGSGYWSGTAATAAAWRQAETTIESVSSGGPPPPPPPPPVVTPDQLSLVLSEDARHGNAQFIAKVDGTQVGSGTVTARNNHGQTQTFDFSGDWGAGQHTVEIDFANPVNGRHLYVDQVNYDSTNYLSAPHEMTNKLPFDVVVSN